MSERPDPIERGFFREAEDGSVVFFPWGLARRGYRLPDAAAKQRAARAARLMVGAAIAFGAAGGVALEGALDPSAPSLEGAARALALPLAAVALALGSYALWASRFVEPLPPSDLRVPREARLREAARQAGPGKVTAIGGATVAMSAALAWLEPGLLGLAALGVATGLGLTGWGLVLRRALREPPGPAP